MPEELVEMHDEFRTDTRSIADVFDYNHKDLRQQVNRYQEGFQELGQLLLREADGKPLPQGGRHKGETYYLLNEDQCYFLLTLLQNADKVVEGKKKLVQAFREARSQLARRDVARVEGKQIRRMETDAIKELVEYAGSCGSNNADMYYTNVTQMTNKVLGLESGERDHLDEHTLKQLSAAEIVVGLAIRDGIGAGMDYKDIYKMARSRAEEVAPALLGNK